MFIVVYLTLVKGNSSQRRPRCPECTLQCRPQIECPNEIYLPPTIANIYLPATKCPPCVSSAPCPSVSTVTIDRPVLIDLIINTTSEVPFYKDIEKKVDVALGKEVPKTNYDTRIDSTAILVEVEHQAPYFDTKVITMKVDRCIEKPVFKSQPIPVLVNVTIERIVENIIYKPKKIHVDRIIEKPFYVPYNITVYDIIEEVEYKTEYQEVIITEIHDRINIKPKYIPLEVEGEEIDAEIEYNPVNLLVEEIVPIPQPRPTKVKTDVKKEVPDWKIKYINKTFDQRIEEPFRETRQKFFRRPSKVEVVVPEIKRELVPVPVTLNIQKPRYESKESERSVDIDIFTTTVDIQCS